MRIVYFLGFCGISESVVDQFCVDIYDYGYCNKNQCSTSEDYSLKCAKTCNICNTGSYISMLNETPGDGKCSLKEKINLGCKHDCKKGCKDHEHSRQSCKKNIEN